MCLQASPCRQSLIENLFPVSLGRAGNLIIILGLEPIAHTVSKLLHIYDFPKESLEQQKGMAERIAYWWKMSTQRPNCEWILTLGSVIFGK